MNVTVEDKGNSKFKITITTNDDVRIKLKNGSDECLCDYAISRFKEVAEQVISEGLNTVTLRGKCDENDDSFGLYTDSKKLVKKFEFDY